MNMKYILLGIIAVACLSAFILSDTDDSNADVASGSGSCGTNLTYTYDATTHALTISGSGTTMDDYDPSMSQTAPWGTDVVSVTFDTPNLTIIGWYNFADCTSLTSVSLPSTLTTIDKYAFYNCSSLGEVALPSSLKEIWDYAFYGCTNLTTTFPDSLTIIRSYAFSHCTSLVFTELPVSLNTIYAGVFDFCTGLVNVISHQYSTTSPLFAGCTNLETVTFANASSLSLMITDEDEYSFMGCSKLKSIALPRSNSYITCDGANLAGITTLETITAGDMIVNSGASFEGCTSLRTIPFLETSSVLPANCFKGCSSLVLDELPKTIRSGAFAGCTSLPETILSHATTVAADAFTDTPQFKYVINCGKATTGAWESAGKTVVGTYKDGGYIGDLLWTVTMIDTTYTAIEVSGNGAIPDYDDYSDTPWSNYLEQAKRIVIGEGVTSIGNNAFYDTYSSPTVIIPSTVTYICPLSSTAGTFSDTDTLSVLNFSSAIDPSAVFPTGSTVKTQIDGAVMVQEITKTTTTHTEKTDTSSKILTYVPVLMVFAIMSMVAISLFKANRSGY